VSKLTLFNYASWKTKIEMQLIREGTWSIVSKRRTRPEGGSKEKSTKEQLKFDEDAGSAIASIFLHLSDTVKEYVTNIRDPVRVLDKLWDKPTDVLGQKGFTAALDYERA
jgi:hypothetical protein